MGNPHEIEVRQDVIYRQLFYRNGEMQQQLSNSLNWTILLVDTDEGDVHSFCWDRTRETGEMVFKCSRCSTANGRSKGKKAVLVILEGRLSYENPIHHHQCRPYSKAEIIRIQLTRRLNLARKV